MGSHRHQKPKCPSCQIHQELCFCEHIRPLDLQTRVSLIIHHLEYRKSTNTGRLAHLLLENSSVHVRGRKDETFLAEDLILDGYENFVLFPYDGAEELTPEWKTARKLPVNLIVPDGTWRQASKMVPHEEALANLPRIKIPQSSPSQYRLRTEHRDDGLATIEAIARALGFIENVNVQTHMEKALAIKVRRQMFMRGKPIGDWRSLD